MKIQSCIQDALKLVPVEVEVTLVPGLPGLQFMGLPDQHVKESAGRIKSALKKSGFEFPSTQTVLVNLRPSHVRKHSKGLDLAIALAFLRESEQIPQLEIPEGTIVYGELSLLGDVFAPDDLSQLLKWQKPFLSGPTVGGLTLGLPCLRVKHLRELIDGKFSMEPAPVFGHHLPTAGLESIFSDQQALLLKLLGVGAHHLLLAGPAGSGKSFLAEHLSSFLKPPTTDDQIEWIIQGSRSQTWRPVIKPHHTIPVISMIGGGSSPRPGEISRAHRGVLVLDELLEFKPLIQEALREPFEEKMIRISRGGRWENYPADCLIVGTTNLCPCGDWTPKGSNRFCRFSVGKCRSYLDRLSGPLLDRFEILSFTQSMQSREIPGDQIRRDIEAAWNFQKDIQVKKGAKVSPSVERELPLIPFKSLRRRKATLKVARTFADLEGSSTLEARHLEAALPLTQNSFEQIRRREERLTQDIVRPTS